MRAMTKDQVKPDEEVPDVNFRIVIYHFTSIASKIRNLSCEIWILVGLTVVWILLP